ncbi:hypothetical protein BS78_04G135300 [Paspalum vaginatum]|nr:hypothetical protein BS78_04G135300 [Paspalum vaginatum]
MYNDDILREILLHLPPLPSTLSRTSLVRKRWLRLLSEPTFLCRFRAQHQKPSLLGIFVCPDILKAVFVPVLDPPDRVPSERLSIPTDWKMLDSHHGLVLLGSLFEPKLAVWDPIARSQRLVPLLPPEMGFKHSRSHSAVLCAASTGDSHVHGYCHLSFKLVVLVCDHYTQLISASIYESESGGLWRVSVSTIRMTVIDLSPGVLVGDTLRWLLVTGDILELDLDAERLSMIEKPNLQTPGTSEYQIMRTGGGMLGLAIQSRVVVQLWERSAGSDGVPTWMLQRTIDLAKLLPVEKHMPIMMGFAEENNIVFVSMGDCLFVLNLDSMSIKKLSVHSMPPYLPLASFII